MLTPSAYCYIDLDFNPVYSNLRDAYDPIGWVRLPRSIGEAQRHYPIIFSSQHGGWMPWLGDILHNRDHLVGANEEVFRWRSGPLHTIMVLDVRDYLTDTALYHPSVALISTHRSCFVCSVAWISLHEDRRAVPCG